MTAPAHAGGRPRAPADRHRQVLARLALAEADQLRMLVTDAEEHRAWVAACELLHRDRELLVATVVTLAAMVPQHVPVAELVAWTDHHDTEGSAAT